MILEELSIELLKIRLTILQTGYQILTRGMKQIQNNICSVEQLKKYIDITAAKEKKLET